jgi:phenylacetate-CoA ligase
MSKMIRNDSSTIWSPNAECARPEELRQQQNASFKGMMERLRSVPFYQDKLEDAAIRMLSITLDDLPGLPLTTKDNLREGYPYGFFACDPSELVELHASSGTTGKPVVVGYTVGDIQTWKSMMARTMVAAGVTRTDVVQNAYGYGLFTGGLGFHYGAGQVGANVIPVSAGRTDLQILIAEDLGATVLCCTPSFALYLAGEVEALGRTLKNTRLRIGLFGAEPWSEEMRGRIESKIGLTAYDVYGLSEMIGPGVAYECPIRDGMHINEDVFFPEVIDPTTGQVLPEGAVGELVLTSLGRQAIPLLRYKTGDLTCLMPGPCECGRTLRKMRRIVGRADDMLIVAGVNFYPSNVESLILGVAGTTGHYQIWLWTQDLRDYIEVRIEAEPDCRETSERDSVALLVAARLRDNIGIRMIVKIVEPGSLDRSVMGKAKRVFDNRGEK